MGHVGCMLLHQVLNNYYALSEDSVIFYSQDSQDCHLYVGRLLISPELCISYGKII